MATERTLPSTGYFWQLGRAAGTATRTNSLATIEGEPIVRRAARSLVVQSEVEDTIVVLGHEAESVREAIGDLDVTVVVNESYDQGQSTSVRVGIQTVSKRNTDATLIALGDMPDVTIGSINSILKAYERGGGDIIAAACDSRRGNPVLFDSRFFDRLTDVSGDIGGRQILFSSDSAILLETGDSGVLRDIDRPEDLVE